MINKKSKSSKRKTNCLNKGGTIEQDETIEQVETIEQDETNGFYKFSNDTTIRFFADLEGMMPDGISALIKNDSNLDKIRTDLKKQNEAIVFTGDLIDRGPNSIQNLLDMCSLKERYLQNVVLTCGNRDLNKIRCYKEFCVEEIETILYNEENRNIDKVSDIFQKVKDNISTCTFKYQATEIEGDINFQGIVNAQNDRTNFVENYSDILQKRIDFIYKFTFGAPEQIKYFRTEYSERFDINFDENVENFYKFIAMMNMIMGRIHDERNIPKCLHKYNGLYIKYLKHCHIMAKITIGYKMIFVSHSGIPYKNNKFIIPKFLGIINESDTTTQGINYMNNIPSLNNELKKVLKYFDGEMDFLHYTGNKNWDQYIENPIYKKKIENSIYKKFIAMASSCGQKENTRRDSELSPVVTISSLNDKGPFKYQDKPINVKSNHEKYYNIFGHQPCGFLPGASRTPIENNKTTYHIDLDISRAEDSGGTANKESYVYLEITKDSDTLVGKTEATRDVDVYDILKVQLIKEYIPEHHEEIVRVQLIKEYNPEIHTDITYENLNVEKKQNEINIIKYTIDLDKYIDNSIKARYNIKPGESNIADNLVHVPLYSVDGNNYYGMCSQNWHLLKYTKNKGTSGGKLTQHKRTTKRFVNGKRKMVIYEGKRGGEYVKVKGNFISLKKYQKILSKK